MFSKGLSGALFHHNRLKNCFVENFFSRRTGACVSRAPTTRILKKTYKHEKKNFVEFFFEKKEKNV